VPKISDCYIISKTSLLIVLIISYFSKRGFMAATNNFVTCTIHDLLNEVWIQSRISKQKEQPIYCWKHRVFANVSALKWCHYQRMNALQQSSGYAIVACTISFYYVSYNDVAWKLHRDQLRAETFRNIRYFQQNCISYT